MTKQNKSIIWKLIGSISGIIAICSMLVYSHKVMVVTPAIKCHTEPLKWMIKEMMFTLDEGLELTDAEKRTIQLKVKRLKSMESK